MLGRSLVDGPLDLREGVVLRVDLGGLGETIVGYRAIKNSDVIDVDRVAAMRSRIFGSRSTPATDRRLILDPDQFYILASREKVQIPSDLAAEMAPIDPAIGEFRVHYAGFFDPGFGQGRTGALPRARSWKCAAAMCRSCSRTASRSDAWSTKNSPAPPDGSMARVRLQLSAPGAETSKHFRL